MNNKLIVISGCSGGGKSTLIKELKSNGYNIIPEVCTTIVTEQQKINGNLTPWENPIGFAELAIKRSIEDYYRATKETFFDRCFIEGIRYYKSVAKNKIIKYDHLISNLRFYPIVFMTPPWRDIYCQNELRKHSFEKAVADYERIVKFYVENGYEIIELPKVSVRKRYEFIVSSSK